MKGDMLQEPNSAPAWFAVASPGLAPAVQEEWRGLLPDRAFDVTPAGAEFVATAAEVRTALPWLRVTTRVWRRLAETKARAFGELERKWLTLPWADYVPPGAKLRVDVTVHRCRLFHSGALRQRLSAAVAHAVGEPKPDVAPEVRLLVRGENDEFQVSVDASGERLNVRGYRQEVGKAPLRETLAAGLLSLCAWRSDEPLVDPMCGSGTLPIEAALRAWRIPSDERSFAMDGWPCRHGDLVTSAASAGLGGPLTIVAADRDATMVQKARRNAARAQVEQAIRFEARPFEALTPPGPRGLLLFNPPYGHRLGTPEGLARQCKAIARTLSQSWGGWRAGLLLPKGAMVDGGACKVVGRHALTNGGLAVELVQVEIASGGGQGSRPEA